MGKTKQGQTSIANPVEEVPPIRRFVLFRDDDVSGTSGTGVVAVGCILPSGTCVMEWTSLVRSIGFYHSIADLERIHGHNGATKVRLLEEDE